MLLKYRDIKNGVMPMTLNFAGVATSSSDPVRQRQTPRTKTEK